jgi:hypothetical protein
MILIGIRMMIKFKSQDCKNMSEKRGAPGGGGGNDDDTSNKKVHVAETEPASEAPPVGAEVSSGNNDDDDDMSTLLGLKSGDELEIKWDMECDGNVEPRWWKCQLVKKDGTHSLEEEEVRLDTTSSLFFFVSTPFDCAKSIQDDTEPEICIVWEVLYEESPPDYPEKSTHRLCFLSDHMLFDIGEDATFCYRQSGSDWDEESDGETEETLEGGASSLGAVTSASASELVDDLMSSIIAKHSQRMASLPYLQQTFVASVIAQSKERLTEKLETTLSVKAARGLKQHSPFSTHINYLTSCLCVQESPARFQERTCRHCSLMLEKNLRTLRQLLRTSSQSRPSEN